MKRFLPLLLCLFALPVTAQQSQLYIVPQTLSLAAKSYVLADFQSGQTLVSQNARERVEPASLTKLMTAYVVFSALHQKRISLTQQVAVSERAWRSPGSRMFIEPSKPVTIDELMRGVIVQSGNDACIALAEAVSGSESGFVQLMNKEAKRLGMKDTRFANSTGLPHPEHYSTAHDLALLGAAMIRDFPEYYPLYSLREYTYNKISQPNRNRLLWLDPNVDGLKTGHTEAAGYCLITSAKRGDRRLISVVMGTASDSARAMESQRLLNHGFQFYDTVRLYPKEHEVIAIQLWKGAQDTLKTGFGYDVYFSLPKYQVDKLKAKMEYKQPLVAPINAGQKVGRVKFTIDGKLVAEHPLVALETVDAANVIGRAWDSMRLMLN
ncbi:D-alanyl-D-alanine carboxypeptidase family protein [Nitrosospira briensis]|uniref:serine-type D-Ala-D-Ala carboxypeptidase n=1 Tax=Nitrosospira briensis TaxID=35799 RepID=A0A1I5D701_9PROT|nr:D-alanyl-D-alanine carboxypeptidase family protein [Nitrosospira briensis]SFN94886.1 D-alanyl-D-alanine carboxypeptidase (penicillin-binding protein 5/6) [Nitrosospira briensis]SFO19012.1 penicillin-binding protein 6. Serine peptidase. MEROPS family S11 [Nitrosospira briensis]